MPYTVPNQRTVNIHREPLGGNFLGSITKTGCLLLVFLALLLFVYTYILRQMQIIISLHYLLPQLPKTLAWQGQLITISL